MFSNFPETDIFSNFRCNELFKTLGGGQNQMILDRIFNCLFRLNSIGTRKFKHEIWNEGIIDVNL